LLAGKGIATSRTVVKDLQALTKGKHPLLGEKSGKRRKVRLAKKKKEVEKRTVTGGVRLPPFWGRGSRKKENDGKVKKRRTGKKRERRGRYNERKSACG